MTRNRQISMAAFLVGAAALVIGFAGCPALSPVLGSWQETESGLTMTITFDANGTYTVGFEGMSMGPYNWQWDVANSQLTLDGPDGSTETYTVSFSGNEMTLDAGGTETVLTRA